MCASQCRGRNADYTAISIADGNEFSFFSSSRSPRVHLRIDNQVWTWQKEKKRKTHRRHNHLHYFINQEISISSFAFLISRYELQLSGATSPFSMYRMFSYFQSNISSLIFFNILVNLHITKTTNDHPVDECKNNSFSNNSNWLFFFRYHDIGNDRWITTLKYMWRRISDRRCFTQISSIF